MKVSEVGRMCSRVDSRIFQDFLAVMHFAVTIEEHTVFWWSMM